MATKKPKENESNQLDVFIFNQLIFAWKSNLIRNVSDKFKFQMSTTTLVSFPLNRWTWIIKSWTRNEKIDTCKKSFYSSKPADKWSKWKLKSFEKRWPLVCLQMLSSAGEYSARQRFGKSCLVSSVFLRKWTLSILFWLSVNEFHGNRKGIRI